MDELLEVGKTLEVISGLILHSNYPTWPDNVSLIQKKFKYH